MSKFILIVIFLIITLFSYSQTDYEIDIFKDKETKLFGIKNYDTDEVLVPASYEEIIDFYNNEIIIFQNNKYSIVKFNGDQIVKPTKYRLSFESLDRMYFGEYSLVDSDNSYYTYFINDSSKCIPTEYYPCWSDSIEIQKTGISEDLLLIQESILCDYTDSVEAFRLVREALEISPNSPSNHLFYANLLFDSDEYSNNLNKIIGHIETAETLEEDNYRNVQILTLKYEVQDLYNVSRDQLKSTKNKLKRLDAVMTKYGLFMQVGHNYMNTNNSSEVTIGLGFLERVLSLKSHQAFYMGLGYERFWENNTNTYKLSSTFLQETMLMSSIDIGLSTTPEINAFFVRPQIGLHYYGAQLTYGYNYISDKKIPIQKGHTFSLQYQFMLMGVTDFYYNKNQGKYFHNF